MHPFVLLVIVYDMLRWRLLLYIVLLPAASITCTLYLLCGLVVLHVIESAYLQVQYLNAVGLCTDVMPDDCLATLSPVGCSLFLNSQPEAPLPPRPPAPLPPAPVSSTDVSSSGGGGAGTGVIVGAVVVGECGVDWQQECRMMKIVHVKLVACLQLMMVCG